MPVQRKYKDADGTSRHAQMDDRAIAAATADVPLVRMVGGELEFGGASKGTVFDDVPTSQQGKWSVDFLCDGFELVLLHVETSKGKDAASVKLRPWIQDASGCWSPLTKVSVDILDVKKNDEVPSQKDSYYACVPIELRTLGAKRMKLELVEHLSGKVSVWACAR